MGIKEEKTKKKKKKIQIVKEQVQLSLQMT